jgi:NAD-dependent deacetylase
VSTTSTAASRVADLLRGAERAVALTGAGISVPSGIPDFRSPGSGLWEKHDPMVVAHIDAWRRDPDRFWSFYSQRFATLTDKRPNEAHLALAELERGGLIRGVITQNIDRLHRKAGTERLIEVHGSIEWSVCLRCGERVQIDRVIALLAEGDGAPRCPTCGAPLKPEVVLFGELLPERALAEAQTWRWPPT